MAVFSEGGMTSPDIYIGLSCICLAVLCVVLNSLVLIHNYHKSRSVARNLYLCLAATDLLTAFFIMLPYTVNVLNKKEQECQHNEDSSCNENYYRKRNVANLFNKLQAIVTWSINMAPNHITAFLALTRYIQIRYPLQHLEVKHVLLALFLSLTWEPLILSCSFLYVSEDNTLYLFRFQNEVLTAEKPQFFGIHIEWRILLVIVDTVAIMLQFFALMASLMTISALIKSYLKPAAGSKRNRNTKSAIRILITNFGSLLTLVSYSIALSLENGGINEMSFKMGIKLLLTTLVFPSVVSTINPIIYIIFTSDFALKL
jgi:hypothetical protein